MRPVRIYLLLCSNKVEWISSVHRDLDEVLAAWDTARKVAETVGIIHVGISRPANSAFNKIAFSMSDCILLTKSARWVFDQIGTYSDAIDSVDGLDLYVALSGWGHAKPGLRDITRAQISAQEDEERVYGSPWLNHFNEVNPEMALEAWSLGVRDDASYHSYESSLHWDMRHALGTTRMDFLMRTRNENDPIHVATSSPPWLIDTPLDSINTTIRCGNALRGAGVSLVADLLQMTRGDLLKIPNFGIKTLNDLAIALRSAAQSGPISKTIHNETYHHAEESSGATKFIIEQKRILRNYSHDIHPSGRSFKLAFESNTSHLSETRLTVLIRRIGIEREKMTLEEIGEEIGITRERVRQIEAQALEIFRANEVWKTELATRLDRILHNREDPLPVQSLGIFDPWFADVENMMSEFEFVLDRILDNQFFILDLNGCRFITRISKSEWRRVVREGGYLLEYAAQQKFSKSNARRGIEELLSNNGSELASELWASVQTMALFAKDEDGIERVVGVGTSAETLVAAVLSSSDRPLHFTEIPKRIQDAFGRSVEARRVHSAARNVCLLFGRGTFGMLRHCPLTAEEMGVLRQETEEIILSGTKERQWSCFELVERLGDLTLDFGDRINQYVLHIALRDSSVLSNLGRFVWSQSGERPSGTQDRIDITQATMSVLQSVGRPMTRDEIREALLRDRGLSGYFQIHSHGSLVRTSACCWGILERDIPLCLSEIRRVCSSAATLLEIDQRGIHLTEIKERLCNLAPEILRIEDPYAILSVLTTDPKFKTSLSGYIYLVSWDGPRRLSQGDAVVAALRNVKEHGIKASELAKLASEILGRPVERENIYPAMVAAGANFNEETGRWVLHEEDETEINEDAGGLS